MGIRKSEFDSTPPKTWQASQRVDLGQSAPRHELHNARAARREVTSGRAALAEPLQFLGTARFRSRPFFHDEAMATFLYRCTKTGLRVQGWVADEPRQPEKKSYEAVTCPACGGVHLVNSASGKTIDDERKPT